MINISQKIKDVCRRKLITPFIWIIICVLSLILCPFINIFHPKSVNNIYDVKKNDNYVNVTADTLYYTGYNLITNMNSTYGYYYALKDSSCIFVVIPIDQEPEQTLYDYNFKAKIISPNKSYKKMLNAFAKDLTWNEQSLSSITDGFVLSNADYHPGVYIFLFWVILIILFISIKNFASALIGLINPELYPVCTFLGKQKQHQLIEYAGYELESENYLQINSMYITENYFIDLGNKQISIIPLSEIIWCYRLGTISLNPKKDPDYAIHFTISDGGVVVVRHKTSDEALELINAIRATEYDIIIGHSESKKRLAGKRVNQQK